MYGVATGITLGQHERVEDLNARMRDRRDCTQQMPVQYDPRPVSSRYNMFPMLEMRVPSNEPVAPNSGYSTSTCSAQITARGPGLQRLATVDHESILQNRCFAMQHGADQAVYVPGSRSDLFIAPTYEGRIESQPFSNLTSFPTFSQNERLANAEGLGGDRFHNCTRTQMRTVNTGV